ncbi:MAG: ROK family transcriptional regulator [Pseudolysinimonas sp.]
MSTAPGTPSWLRERNDRIALGALFEHGPLTRTRLGELTGMSKPTAAQMVARLEQAGVIAPVGEVSAGRGPNAVSYGVRADVARGVAIDIREHVIAAQVVDARDTEHPVVEIATGPTDRTPEGDVRQAIDAATAAAGVDAATVRFVCVGVQAAISADGDRLSFTDTLPGWPELGARHRIADALGMEVELGNDVNLAAVAERATGAGRDADSFALLWLSDGLGVAVDLAGTVHRGATGGAGEIGYLPVPRGTDADAEDLTDLVGRGAFERLSDLDAYAERVALVAAPVIAVLDPELIVLGGPIGISGGDDLARRVAERLGRTAVGPTALRTQPVLGGARRLLSRTIRAHLEDLITATP